MRLSACCLLVALAPLITACAGNPPPQVAEPVGGAATAEKDALFVSDVSDVSTYAITDGQGLPITENDFVRRYRRVTGSDALTPYDRGRRTGLIVGGIVIMGSGLSVGLPLAVYGAQTNSQGQSRNTGVAIAGIITATIGAFVGGFALFGGLTDQDGDPMHDHFLTASDARLYVMRYNQALLQKAPGEGQSR
jgi:hypothetical protein